MRDTPYALTIHAVEENSIVGRNKGDKVELGAPERESTAGRVRESLLIEGVEAPVFGYCIEGFNEFAVHNAAGGWFFVLCS